jgi:hypothetical protein
MKYEIEVLIPDKGDESDSVNMTLNLISEMTRSEVLEMLFGWFNHGSGSECQMFLERKGRSLSVNDFVRLNDEWFQCRSMGWEKVDGSLVKSQIDQAKALCVQGHGQVSMWSALYTLNQGDNFKFYGDFKD